MHCVVLICVVYTYIFLQVHISSYTLLVAVYSGTSPLGTLWDLGFSPCNTEVSSIQRSSNTLQYYAGTQNGVLIIYISAIQRFVIEGFHCIQYILMSVWYTLVVPRSQSVHNREVPLYT